MESNYLQHIYKPNLMYKPIEITSFPFPPNTIPAPLNSKYFFIENIDGKYYLRHLNEQLFCMPLASYDATVHLPVIDENGNSIFDQEKNSIETEEHKISFLCAHFQSERRSVGYIFNGKSTLFLNLHKSDKKLSDLPEHLRSIYKSADCHSIKYLEWDNEATTKQINSEKLNKSNISPKGPWEAELFRVNFNSNPDMLTDDEFEMIFGQSR